MRQARGQTGRRLGGGLLGALFAVLVAWSPAAIQPVLAAGPLQVGAETVYTVDPGEGRVHVAIDYTITNNKPNTSTTIYFYRELTFGIQPDVDDVRASDDDGGLGVSTRDRGDYTEVEVRLRANLNYRRTATFTLRYDLVGGKPRSDSPIRVGRAFATFGVWAFGDENRGMVEVRLPQGFTSTVDGDAFPETSGGVGSGTVLRAEPDDPNAFFAIVSADNVESFEEQRISLAGGVEIIVKAWPEDDEWGEQVATTMEQGVPKLQELIGLGWPVFRDLAVQERYTPSLEGYAGVFIPGAGRIDMSEDLDPITTLHEASHAWFNDSLFQERWITEGLAEDYSLRAHEAIGGGPHDPPEAPDPEDPGFVRLNEWEFPAIVREDTDAIEIYGYGASAWLLRLIVEEAGVEGMREAFSNASLNLTAYPGAGEPEHVAVRDDWRRFLDLTQPIDEPDDEAIIQALRDFVLAPGQEAVLSDRAAARADYRDLLAESDGWVPPWLVRRSMGEWLFTDATVRIAQATGVLALRDQVAAAASAEGLTPDDALELAYEGARESFDGATALAQEQLATIASIAAARGKVDATPDLVAQLGLLGETPRVTYDGARAAFEAGDLPAARSSAEAAVAVIDRAPALGQERLVTGAGFTAGVLVLLLVAFLLLRRRRRRAVAARASAASLAALDARFAPTLGADPDGPPTPIGEAPPRDEGGPTDT